MNILYVNFDKFNIGLHFLLIFSMLAKFSEDQRLIVMSSIEYLHFKFLQSKIMHKNKFKDRIVNNIQLA